MRACYAYALKAHQRPTKQQPMTPAQFLAKWKDNPLSERAGSQAFFLDLCSMLGVEPPNDPDSYCFERGATRTGAGHGWADVWKRGHFGWENKGPDGDLSGALRQLMTYALALDNPPLLVVSNRAITQIHTHFTGTPSETYTIRLNHRPGEVPTRPHGARYHHGCRRSLRRRRAVHGRARP